MKRFGRELRWTLYRAECLMAMCVKKTENSSYSSVPLHTQPCPQSLTHIWLERELVKLIPQLGAYVHKQASLVTKALHPLALIPSVFVVIVVVFVVHLIVVQQ